MNTAAIDFHIEGDQADQLAAGLTRFFQQEFDHTPDKVAGTLRRAVRQGPKKRPNPTFRSTLPAPPPWVAPPRPPAYSLQPPAYFCNTPPQPDPNLRVCSTT